MREKKAFIRLARGSLTVEAAVILPFFLFVFFIFLFVIKAVYVQAALDHAVDETTHEIAAISYPLSFFNEWEDEVLAEGVLYGNENKKDINNNNEESLPNIYSELFKGILDGNLISANVKGILEIVYGSSFDIGLQSIEADLIRELGKHYIDLQVNGKYTLVNKIISRHLDTHKLNRNRVALCLVHLPQSDYGYNNTKLDESYQKTGLLPERDFSKDDVVIQAQYDFVIPLPFMSQKSILLKSTSIERAWLNGGNGIYTDRTEKGLFEQAQEEIESTVYITRTGVKYHLSGCRYLRKSKIPISREEAIKSYQPCKVCRPP